MSGTIGAIYQSNLGKWAFLSFSLILVFISAPFISQDLSGFSAYQIQIDLDQYDFDYPNDQGIHELFTEQAKKTPHHVAIDYTASLGA